MEMIFSFPLLVRSQAAMFLSATLYKSPTQKKISAMENGSLYSLHFAPYPPVPRRIPLTKAEAEFSRSRASSSMPETTPERRKSNYGSILGDAEESESVSVWDSNAEGIRRSWRTNKRPSSSSRSAEARSDAYAPDTESSWQWWRSGPDDDDYEDDTDDDDEDDESIFSWLNFDNFDMLSAFSMLRWLLPAAALFLPWLFGGPMLLMIGFAVFPLAQKILGLFVPRDWKDALRGRNARGRQQQGRSSRSSNRRNEDSWAQTSYSPFADDRGKPEFNDSNNGDWERSFLHDSIGQGLPTSKLGGWDDEEVDNFPARKAVKRGNKKFALQRRRSRKEAPLFFRLLVALFPFLRSWGGFL